MARLDRLGPAKEVAQIGAAIGREFSHALLAAVVRKPEAELASALDRLIAAGLLFRQGVPPHATYLFKHALVQDAAYGTLLREPRRALHARIAETLESQFAEIAENQPELLARHCTEAGLIEKAAEFWGKAGQRSLQRSAAVEASEQLTRAVNQIALLPASPALRRQEITFQVALANALMHTKGYAAPEAKSAFDQARLLMERPDGPDEPFEPQLAAEARPVVPAVRPGRSRRAALPLVAPDEAPLDVDHHDGVGWLFRQCLHHCVRGSPVGAAACRGASCSSPCWLLGRVAIRASAPAAATPPAQIPTRGPRVHVERLAENPPGRPSQ